MVYESRSSTQAKVANAASLTVARTAIAGLAGSALVGLLMLSRPAFGLALEMWAGQSTQTASAPSSPAQYEDIVPILKTPWKGDLDEMAKRRVVRVLVPFRRPEFFYMEGRPAGILQESFQELETSLNVKYKTTARNRIVVMLLPTPVDRVRERLAGGYADIAAGSISITDSNQLVADFTRPTMEGLKVIAVTGPGAPGVRTLEDLGGQDVWVMPGTRMKQDVEDLNARLKAQGKPAIHVREADSLLEPGDVLEMVNAGIYPIALMTDSVAEFWSQVFDKITLRRDLAVAKDVQLGWAIQKGTPKLKAYLDSFITAHGVGTPFGNTVLQRYLKQAKYVKNATEVSEMKKFRATLPIFKKYSVRYNLDYLLMTAQGYQESRLDQSVRSRAGAVGIMQVMPATAASAPVKIRDISTEENNIHAGARLVNFLIEDHFNEPGVDLPNRMFFAMAAYNAGPANVARCRKLAREMGFDPNKWFNNVEVAAARVIGRETTQYVANIYKYYICYRLAEEAVRHRDTSSPMNKKN